MSFWLNFWAQKKDGLHRYKSEEFFEKQAREVVFHLEGGDSLLDFGCGSAELLVYYANNYSKIIGVDFSESMLDQARQRISEHNCRNVQLIHGDETTIWPIIDQRFDRIIACGVVQYLSLDQIDKLISEASKKLTDSGKIILFNFIEPSFLFLRKIDAINRKRSIPSLIYKIVKLQCHVLGRKIRHRLDGTPIFEIGYSYRPSQIQEIAEKYDLSIDCVWSMYYEYRYHVILTKR